MITFEGIRTFIAIATVSFALAGCVTPNGSQASTTVNATVVKVQSVALQVCAYRPAADAVVAIVNKPNANVQTAQEIAYMICAAVENAAGRTPVVQGVRIAKG